MTYAQAAATYQRNAVLTASPEKLVKLLYDGAIKNLEISRNGLTSPATNRSPETSAALSKAIGIVAIVGFSVVILVVALLPETRGKALAVYD